MAESKLTKAQHLGEAAAAHTNLTVFSSVISLMEGGHLYGSTPHRSANRIIAICKEEAQRQLRIYDKHAASALQGGSEQ